MPPKSPMTDERRYLDDEDEQHDKGKGQDGSRLIVFDIPEHRFYDPEPYMRLRSADSLTRPLHSRLRLAREPISESRPDHHRVIKYHFQWRLDKSRRHGDRGACFYIRRAHTDALYFAARSGRGRLCRGYLVQ
jgi:hypothetical protein